MALRPEDEALFANLGVDPSTVSPEDLKAVLNLFLGLGPGGRRALLWLAQNASDVEFDIAVGQLDQAVIRSLSQLRPTRIV